MSTALEIESKTAFMYGPHDLRVETVELREPTGNEVVVRIKACGICGSDVECFEGHSAEGRYDLGPYTPGHEWAGEVVAVGPGVRQLEPGHKVSLDCVMQCFACGNCKDGLMPSACENMREGGFRPDSPGGMAEYLISEEPYVHRLPDDWSFEEGAWVEPFSIGYFGIWGNGGYIDASDIAIIFGGGPIGLTALMVAKTAHARAMLVEPLPNRQEYGRKLGADWIVDPSAGNLHEQVLDLTGGRGGTVVVEASGNDNAIASIFDVAAHSARVRLIGHSIGRKVPVEIGLTIWKTLSITGSVGTRNFGRRTIRFMDQIRDIYDVRDLITHRFNFTQIHDAFDVAVNNKAEAIKVMLNFD